MDDSPLLALQDKRALFATLKQHPAWQPMTDHYRNLKDTYEKGLGARLMGGAALDQQELDFRRGYFAGVFAVLTSPDAAEAAWMRGEQKLEASRGRKENVNV